MLWNLRAPERGIAYCFRKASSFGSSTGKKYVMLHMPAVIQDAPDRPALWQKL